MVMPVAHNDKNIGSNPVASTRFTKAQLRQERDELSAKLQRQYSLQQCRAASKTLVSLKRVTNMLLAAELRKG